MILEISTSTLWKLEPLTVNAHGDSGFVLKILFWSICRKKGRFTVVDKHEEDTPVGVQILMLLPLFTVLFIAFLRAL